MDSAVSEETINIRYSDLDFKKRLKPVSILNFFQDIAVDNAEKYGFGESATTPKNLMWVLLKYRIEFTHYPTDIKTLTLKTEPRGYHKLFAYRNFEISTEGKLVARASTMWSLVNFKTKTLVNVETSFDSPYMSKFVAGENDLSFGKIPPMTQVDAQKEFEVRYNDIDGNRHANNGNYIIWALEPLAYEFRKHHQLKTLDIAFKKEIKLGEKLISKAQILGDNQTLHVLTNAESGEDLCLFLCDWEEINT